MHGIAPKGQEAVVNVDINGQRFAFKIKHGEACFEADIEARQNVLRCKSLGELDGSIGRDP